MSVTKKSPTSSGEDVGAGKFGDTTTTTGGKVFMGMRPPPQQTFGSYGAAVAAGQAQVSQQYQSYGAAVAAGKKQVAKRNIFLSVADALASYDTWTDKKRQDFLAKLKISGLVQADAGEIEAYRVWQVLVEESARKTANGRNVSPFDILGSYASQAGGMGKGAWQTSADGRWKTNVVTGERQYVGPRFTTTTDSRIDVTDPATARAIATKMFQELMGRDPGKGELANFGTALSSAEASNPAVATTTTEYGTAGAQAGEVIGSSTVTSGGVSAEGKAQIAEEQAKKKPEYGATQSATTYMNALENEVYGAPE
jgi:hypothetical protein